MLRQRTMAAPVGFYEWLTKQKGQRNPVGELARSVARDAEFPRDMATLEQVLEHLRQSSNASAESLAVARSAYRAYERSVKPAPRV
jgi:uncharacterized protein YozE (UPF0346 family)